MNKLPAIIPVAGKGTRLYPLTKKTPKALLPLNKKTKVIDHILDELLPYSDQATLIVSHENYAAFQKHLGHQYKSIEIYYAVQREQKGLAHAIQCAIPDKPFLLVLGDSVITYSDKSPIHYLVTAYKQIGYPFMLVQAVTDPSQFGIVRPYSEIINGFFSISGIVEKPSITFAPSSYSAAGIYILPPSILDVIESMGAGINNEYQLSDAITMLCASNTVCCAILYPEIGRILDIGTPESYASACELFGKKKISLKELYAGLLSSLLDGN